MRKVILHIGRHKSGTTALQEYMYAHKKWLNDNGFIYPQIYFRSTAHHLLSLKFRHDKLKDLSKEDIDILLDQARSTIIKNTLKDQIIIISAEGFQNCDPGIIRRLFSKGDFDVKIVCYFRDQVSYLATSYAQAIHQRLQDIDLNQYIKNANPNYYLFISEWKKYFDNIVVRNFSKKTLINQDIIDDFIENVLELKRPDTKQFISNPSLTRRYLSFKYMYNKKYQNGLITQIDPPSKLYKLLGEFSRTDDSGKFLLIKPDAQYVYEKYKESNKLFFSTYLIKDQIYGLENNFTDQQYYEISEDEFWSIYNRINQNQWPLLNTNII